MAMRQSPTIFSLFVVLSLFRCDSGIATISPNPPPATPGPDSSSSTINNNPLAVADAKSPDFETEYAACHAYALNRSRPFYVGYPQWYLDTYILPMLIERCLDPIKLMTTGNISDGYVTFDGYKHTKTGEAVDPLSFCDSYIPTGKKRFMMDFYAAFYGFKFNGVPRYTKIYSQLVVWCSPLALLGLVWGMVLCRRHASDAEHSSILKALGVTAVLVYATVALYGSHYFGIFLAWPLCYIGNFYMSYSTEGFADYALYPQTLNTFYCLNQCFQALLVLHYVCKKLGGIGCYSKRIATLNVTKVIAGLWSANVVIFILHFFAISYVIGAMTNAAWSPARRAIQGTLGTVCLVANILQLALSTVIQIGCCVKLWRGGIGSRQAPESDTVPLCDSSTTVHTQGVLLKLFGGICALNLASNVSYVGLLGVRLVLNYVVHQGLGILMYDWQYTVGVSANICTLLALGLHLAAAARCGAKQPGQKVWAENAREVFFRADVIQKSKAKN